MIKDRVKRIRSNQKGFTLIELLVVIGILGILAAALIPSFTGFREDAMRSNVESEIRMIESSIKAILARDGELPTDNTNAFSSSLTASEVERLLGDVFDISENEDIVSLDIEEDGSFQYIRKIKGEEVTFDYSITTGDITIRP